MQSKNLKENKLKCLSRENNNHNLKNIFLHIRDLSSIIIEDSVHERLPKLELFARFYDDKENTQKKSL